MTKSKPPAPQPQPCEPAFRVWGLGGRTALLRPPLHPRDPVARSWLRDSRAPPAPRGKMAAAEQLRHQPWLQARPSAILAPSSPSPPPRKAAFGAKLPGPEKRKKIKTKKGNQGKKEKKNHPNTKSPPRRSPPHPGPQADTGLAGGLRTGDPSAQRGRSSWPGPWVLVRASRPARKGRQGLRCGAGRG